jgi:hypothetical protein
MLGKNCVIVIYYGWRCGHAIVTLTIHADHINHYRNVDLSVNAHSLEYRNGTLLVRGTERLRWVTALTEIPVRELSKKKY